MGKTDEQATIKLIINGEQAKTTVKDVRQTMIGLERTLVNMKKADDPAGFEKLRKQLEKTKQAHQQMVQEIRGGEGSIGRLKLGWKDIASGAAIGAGAVMLFNKALEALPGLVSKAGELSDSLADIQKQTGLAGEELESLNEELGKMNTRTSIDELRGLAAIAGKLGYQSKADVLSFVRAADMINVSLGEDLGGNIEETINDVGKLVDIFGIKEEFGIETAMLKVGSAINTIGASSAANEGYLVAWAKRFAGIAPNAGISIADTLGMAAASDILGQSSELSATNIGKMIIAMGKDIPYFAKVAKMEVGEFSHMLKTDGNEAFIRVLEGSKSSTKGVEGLVKMLATLGIEGSEGAQVLGAFAKNTELVRKQQDIANQSFEKGTSIMDEFNVKNQNTAAILAKIGGAINLWIEKAAAGLNPFIAQFGRLFGVTSALEIQLQDLKAQEDRVARTDKDLKPLIDRYDQLKSNVSLTKEQQIELKKVTNDIAGIVPTAVTQWDAYGNALDINSGKTRDFIKEQRSLMETMRQNRRDMLQDELKSLQKQAQQGKYDLNLGRSYAATTGGVIEVKFSEKEFLERRKKLQDLQTRINKTKTDLDAMNGIFPKEPEKKAVKKAADVPAGNDAHILTQKEIKDAQDAAKKLNDELLKNQQALTLAMMGEHEKELQAAENKYDALREKSSGNAAALKRVAAQQVQEVSQINDKYTKKYLADFEKTMRGQIGFLNKGSEERNKFNQEWAEKDRELAEGERGAINTKYERLLEEARLNGFETISIYRSWTDELNNLQQEQAAKEIALVQKTEDEKQKKAEKAKKDKEKAESDKEEAFRTEMENMDKLFQAASYTNEAVGAILQLSAKNQEQNAEFQKNVALFQIAIDAAKAISGAVVAATSGANPYTIALQVTAAVAAVSVGILKAKQVMSEAKKPNAPAFRADGGPTDLGSIMNDNSGNPEGWVNRPTLFSLGRRSYVAGEAGREYVISGSMLRNPAVADFAHMLEAMRQQRYFANGGSTAMSTAEAAPYDPRLDETNKLLRMLIAKQGNGWNYSAFEEFDSKVKDIRRRASA
jgi:TP901 family phage tail tape measure protein